MAVHRSKKNIWKKIWIAGKPIVANKDRHLDGPATIACPPCGKALGWQKKPAIDGPPRRQESTAIVFIGTLQHEQLHDR